MQSWGNIENKINSFLEKAITLLKKLIVSILPESLTTRLNLGNENKAKKKLESEPTSEIPASKKLKDHIQKLLIPVAQKALEIKGIILTKIGQALAFIQNITPAQLNPKRIINAIIILITPALVMIKTWSSTLSPSAMLGLLFAASITIVSSISIISSGNKIYSTSEHEEKMRTIQQERDISSTGKKPAYHLSDRRRATIYNLDMPVYIESVTSFKSLILDFSLETTNRYTSKFINDQPDLIKDRLNSTIEPIIPEFPLTPEGKDILKEKIQKEVNGLLKELKVDGEIKDVHFQNVVSG